MFSRFGTVPDHDGQLPVDGKYALTVEDPENESLNGVVSYSNNCHMIVPF